jgi:hypothetical protein
LLLRTLDDENEKDSGMRRGVGVNCSDCVVCSFDSKSRKHLNVIEIHDLQFVEIDKSAEIRDRANQILAGENSERK